MKGLDKLTPTLRAAAEAVIAHGGGRVRDIARTLGRTEAATSKLISEAEKRLGYRLPARAPRGRPRMETRIDRRLEDSERCSRCGLLLPCGDGACGLGSVIDYLGGTSPLGQAQDLALAENARGRW